MPRKATTAKPDPAEDAGEPIVVRREIMKDAAPTPTPVASEAIETRPKKTRIEPLSAAATKAESPASEPTLDLSATPDTAKPTNPKPAAAVTPPAPKAETPPKTTPQPATEAETSKPAATEPKKAETTLAPAVPAENFSLGSKDTGSDDTDTPDDPSQNPIDQAKAKADKAAAEKQAALDKVVAAETYFLPINSVEKRRTKQLLLVSVLLFVVVAGAGAFWANGQGIISIPGL
jgi:hypothetical protein